MFQYLYFQVYTNSENYSRVKASFIRKVFEKFKAGRENID